MSVTTHPSSPLADDVSAAFSAWRTGDERALERLVQRVTPLLWHVARSYRIDAAAAEDAVQATWLALVGHAETVQQPQAVLRWLIVAVQREAARTAHRAARTQPTEPDTLREGPDPVAGPEDDVLDRSTTAVLWRHVAELPEGCRRLLRVVAFTERPDYRGLSRELGIPVGSIGPTRGRCLGKLRSALDSDPEWVVA